MTETNSTIEQRILQAERLIQEAKNCLNDEYNNYKNIQEWMTNMEDMRLKTSMLLSKCLLGRLI